MLNKKGSDAKLLLRRHSRKVGNLLFAGMTIASKVDLANALEALTWFCRLIGKMIGLVTAKWKSVVSVCLFIL